MKNKHLATSGLQGAYLVLAFVLGDRVLDFLLKEARKLQLHPQELKVNSLPAFVGRPAKAEPYQVTRVIFYWVRLKELKGAMPDLSLGEHCPYQSAGPLKPW